MVYIFFAEGFEEVEGLTVVDVLRRAKIETYMVGVTGLSVTGAHGIKVEMDMHIDEISQLDTCECLVLPGGGLGTQNLKKSNKLRALVGEMNEKQRLISAICAAPTALSEFGVLTSKNFTCYPSMEVEIPEGNHIDKHVVVDANVVTSKGVGTALDFSLELVRQIKGEALAESLYKSMVMHS